jgi:hypothetical protein
MGFCCQWLPPLSLTSLTDKRLSLPGINHFSSIHSPKARESNLSNVVLEIFLKKGDFTGAALLY